MESRNRDLVWDISPFGRILQYREDVQVSDVIQYNFAVAALAAPLPDQGMPQYGEQHDINVEKFLLNIHTCTIGEVNPRRHAEMCMDGRMVAERSLSCLSRWSKTYSVRSWTNSSFL